MAVQCAAETEVAPQDRFDYFWNQRGEWVEEPNVRRGGESGVQRLMGSDGQLLYAKRQTGHIYRSLQHPFGRPTVLREHDCAHRCDRTRRARSGNRFLRRTARSVAQMACPAGHQVAGRLRGNRSLVRRSAVASVMVKSINERVLKDLAENLARMHKGRWQHSCLYTSTFSFA